jgi:hypothetical protein
MACAFAPRRDISNWQAALQITYSALQRGQPELRRAASSAIMGLQGARLKTIRLFEQLKINHTSSRRS